MDRKLVQIERILSRALALGVVLLGLAVLTGWYLHYPALLQIRPSFAPMQYNTALAFLLSGLALLTLHGSSPRITRALALGVTLIGGLTLWQIMTGMDLYIDQLFMQHYISTKTATPGRMAPNTALCFLLTGINLLVLTSTLPLRIKANINGVFAPVILALAMISLMGYAVGVDPAYGWGNLTQMALHTATGFIVISLIFYGQRQLWNKFSLLLSFALLLLLLVLTLWQTLDTQENTTIRMKATQRLDQILENWRVRIDAKDQAMQRIATRWKHTHGLSKAQMLSDATNVARDLDFIFFARYSVDAQDVLVIGDPALATSIKASLPRNICQSPDKEKKLLHSVAGRADPLLLTVIPLALPKQADGCIVAASSLQQLINKLRSQTISEQYPMAVLVSGSTVYQESSDGLWHVQSTLPAVTPDAHLRLTPTQAQMARSVLPTVVLAGGITCILLAGLALYWAGLARRKANESAELQSRFKLIVESAPSGMVMVNRGGIINLVNQQTEKIFGYPRAELLGQKMEVLLPARYRVGHPQQREGFFHSPSMRAMGTDQVLYALRKDGSEFPVEIGLNPIESDEGLMVLASITDISARLAADQAIQTGNERLQRHALALERSNKELDTFAYVASHDLKSPLRGIDQLATWITEDMGDNLPPGVKKHLQLMRSRVNRMECLLNDLLAYARVGRQEYQLAEVDTRKLALDIFGLLSHPKSIQLTVIDPMPTLITLQVPLEMVLRNLINNAIKHHDKPHGTVTLSATSAPDGYIFTVADDGPGIPPEHQERVFGIFQTLRPRDDVEGSGMGLAIVKKVIENYGGSITLISDGSHGCRFQFTWPNEATIRSHIHAHGE